MTPPMTFLQRTRALLATALLVVTMGAAFSARAAEADIRKVFAERLGSVGPIDEIIKSTLPGLFEVRIGKHVFFTTADASYLVEGELIDVKTGTNLTEERLAKLTAVDFASLPFKDAVVWKQGDGSRKVVVFADPNCGACKQFEQELRQAKDVTVYVFLVAVLRPDSVTKARNIWCMKDRVKAWSNWMVDGVEPPRAMGPCDTSGLTRVKAVSERIGLDATPMLVFENGRRIIGALPVDRIESMLRRAGKPL